MPETTPFHLQPVLNFKASQVDTLEVEFAQLKGALQNEVEALLALKAAERQEIAALRQAQQKGRLDAEGIRQHQAYLQTLHEQIARQEARVAEAERRLEAKREALVRMMQDRQALEKLRERHESREARAALRREAREVDEIVTTRYGRER